MAHRKRIRSSHARSLLRWPASLVLALAFVLAIAVTSRPQAAEPTYIQFEPSATKGALYVPDGGQRSDIAFLVMHRTSNFLSHPAAIELSRRGFLVLAMNPRSDNNEAMVRWETNALDVRQGVDFLRHRQGVRKVVLIGHSGGGPTMSFYQAVAEQGSAYCSGAEKLSPCSTSLDGLSPADGLVLLDAHPGNSVNALRSLNPAVTDESHPDRLDPTLDPFDPRNGFDPNGNSTYPPTFLARYTTAQADRMNRLINKALAMQVALKTPGHIPPDDDAFIVYRDSARLSDVSTGVWCCTLKPAKLVKNDGTTVTDIVRTVRVANPKNAETDKSLVEGGLPLTVKSFLSANAIRSTASLDGIDWCSSNNSTPCAVARIAVPTLVAAMQGHYFIRDGETIFDASASRDKDFVVIEGATHGLAPCAPCSRTTGIDYDNARENLFDYVAAWARAHVDTPALAK